MGKHNGNGVDLGLIGRVQQEAMAQAAMQVQQSELQQVMRFHLAEMAMRYLTSQRLVIGEGGPPSDKEIAEAAVLAVRVFNATNDAANAHGRLVAAAKAAADRKAEPAPPALVTR